MLNIAARFTIINARNVLFVYRMLWVRSEDKKKLESCVRPYCSFYCGSNRDLILQYLTFVIILWHINEVINTIWYRFFCVLFNLDVKTWYWYWHINILNQYKLLIEIHWQQNVCFALLTSIWNGHMELAPLVDALPAERLTAPIGYRTSILTSTFAPEEFLANIYGTGCER